MTLKPSEWTKSSYSTNDGPECVEVAYFKSSYSASNSNDCVEVAATPDTIRIRDSKHPRGPQLAVTPAAWTAFLTYAGRR
ncbi:DUF397 domain-containing protein [Streptomyces milbemycinicus]|uniref:DUF397 domain-containing protein n=1 Tax=Streptomyces milbemycinicus TaxID=476552 RepID=A0ABW8LYV3_9ACTN